MIDIRTNDVLRPERVAVDNDRDLVVMTFGNVQIKMHYLQAFKFSQWVRLQAKQCKKTVGDNGRHLSLMGVLTDANETRG